ncbi:MAG TPA: acyltransferase [Pirellulaceae bacterium]|nr:acyltransferase [Pirellulaceae bacterium]
MNDSPQADGATALRDASPAPVSYPRPRRLELLDVWRGTCCLMLVVFHASMQGIAHRFWNDDRPVDDLGSALLWLAARTWIGVPIFFVISGYCIMATLTARVDRGGAGEFLKRRFVRIYPPYWIALAVSAIAIILIESKWPGVLTGGTFSILHPLELPFDVLLGNVTLTESWRHCLGGSPSSHLLPNTWTLAYEEQFYVVAALILVALPRRILTAFALFTVVAMSGKVISKLTGIDVHGSIFDGQWLLIACGLLLYWRIHFARGWQVHATHAALALGIVAHLRDPARLLEAMPNHDIDRFVAFAFTLATSLTIDVESRIARWSVLEPLRRVGRISYSIYLSHAVVAKGISHAAWRAGVDSPLETMLVVVPTCVLASIGSGVVFYRLVERHFIPSRSTQKPATDSATPASEVESGLPTPLPAGASLALSATPTIEPNRASPQG